MLEKKYLAPNAITATSLFLGFLSVTTSIKSISTGDFNRSIFFIIAAMICDGLDGKAARKLDAFSEFGKEFDSFADAISFGIAPGILIYCKLVTEAINSAILVPVSFLYAFCGVMRLVKFNVITVASAEKGDFSGMPIPNAAAMVCSYLLISKSLHTRFGFSFYDREFFIGISLLAAILMISTIRFRTPDKTFYFIPKKLAPGLILAAVATAYYSIFLISSAYVLINLFYHIRNRVTTGDDEDDSPDEEVKGVTEYLPLYPKEEKHPKKAAAFEEEPEKPAEEKKKRTKRDSGIAENAKESGKKSGKKGKRSGKKEK